MPLPQHPPTHAQVPAGDGRHVGEEATSQAPKEGGARKVSQPRRSRFFFVLLVAPHDADNNAPLNLVAAGQG